MRFLLPAGRTRLRYGCILKVYDRRHNDIWGRRPQLVACDRLYFHNLGDCRCTRPIKPRCPNFPAGVSELGQHPRLGTGPFP
jgi:hypothetical protein